MARIAPAVMGGLACVGVLEAAASGLARVAWPAYAAAVPDRSYSLAMLVVRLAVGAVIVGLSAYVARQLAAGDRRAAVWTGMTVLAVSLPWHAHIWPHYPVWYHLTWFAEIVPAALLAAGATARP